MTDRTKGFSFKTESKNVLLEDVKPDNSRVKTTANMGRKPKNAHEKIVKKVSLTLTQSEYDIFKADFVVSGFPSESSFLKHLLKKNNIL